MQIFAETQEKLRRLMNVPDEYQILFLQTGASGQFSMIPLNLMSRTGKADYAVTGNSCPKGADYGRAELTHPTRVVTSTVRCEGGAYPRCPVKTNGPIPKGDIFAAVSLLDGVTVKATVQVGQVVVENICGTGVDFVATRNM